MKKLKTLNEIKFLLLTDISYFYIYMCLNLKERYRNLNEAINSQKQETKLILQKLHLNLKLN
jgi:hypothetical protein